MLEIALTVSLANIGWKLKTLTFRSKFNYNLFNWIIERTQRFSTSIIEIGITIDLSRKCFK